VSVREIREEPKAAIARAMRLCLCLCCIDDEEP